MDTSSETKKLEQRIRRIFEENGENLEAGTELQATVEQPEDPDFPFIALTAAASKDFIDVWDVTGIMIIVTTILSVLIGVGLFIWVLGKAHGGWWKRPLIGKLWQRKVVQKLWLWLMFTLGVEFIPIVKIIPANTIFILLAHYREKKIVKLFNLALEEMRSGGLKL